MTDRIVCVRCGKEGHHSNKCKQPIIEGADAFHRAAEDGVQNALLAILANPQGVTVNEVSDLIGLRVDSTAGKLRTLRERGEIGPDKMGGCRARWLLAGPAAAARLKHAEDMRRRASEQQSSKRQLYRRIQEAAELDAFEDQPVHRIVPAHLASALTLPAVRWVFDLGQAA